MGIHILGEDLHHQLWTPTTTAIVALIILTGILAWLVKVD